MNVTKLITRQGAAISSTSKVFISGRTVSTLNTKFQYCVKRQLFPVASKLQFKQQSVRFKSNVEACNFEVINVQDEEDFKKRVLESEKPVVVDFHATWCGPCKILGPRLEKLLADQNGEVVMAKVDIDENSDLAMEYGVRSVPTVMAVKNGEVQDQFVGVIDEDKIQTFVDKLVIC